MRKVLIAAVLIMLIFGLIWYGLPIKVSKTFLDALFINAKKEYPVEVEVEALEDFFFIIEGRRTDDDGFVTLIDTKDNVIGKDLWMDGYICGDYDIPDNDLIKIYDYIMKYNIIDLNSTVMYRSTDQAVEPNYYYKIQIDINGELYTVTYDSSIGFTKGTKLQNLARFHEYIIDYYNRVDEYKAFPDPVYPW